MNRETRLKQIKTYVPECFRRFKNEHGWKVFISSAIIAVIICLVNDSEDMFKEYQATQNGAFALVCACIWIGIFNSIQSICKDRAEGIIKRNHRTGMHISSFVVSHLIFELVLCIVESILVTGIFCIFVSKNLPSSGVIFPTVLELWLAFFLTIFVSDALALMVSCIVKTPNTAMTVMPFILILQLVLSGFIFMLKKGSFGDIISNITIAKWSLNAICITANVNTLIPSEADPRYKLMEESFERSKDACEYSAGNFLMNCGILIGFVALYTIIGILFLERVDKDKRGD